MFVFAIETGGRTVAFTKETDRIMLGAILTTLFRSRRIILASQFKTLRPTPSPENYACHVR